MIESPLIQEVLQEILAEKTAEKARERAHRDILTFLETRFGLVPPDLAAELQSVTEDDRLTDLVRKAASCPDLESFRDAVRR